MVSLGTYFLGVISGVVTWIQPLEHLWPYQRDGITMVRIGVGEQFRNVQDNILLDGNTPGIRLFDKHGYSVGESRGGGKKQKHFVPEGDFIDIPITGEIVHMYPSKNGFEEAKMKVKGRGAAYISVSAGGPKPICVSYVAVTQPSGVQLVWYGDIGKQCGGSWYHSAIVAGISYTPSVDQSNKYNGNWYRPYCLWIDGSAGKTVTQGMGIHLIDFAAGTTTERINQYRNNYTQMCGSKPRFHLYNKITTDHYLPYFDPPLEYAPDGSDFKPNLIPADGSTQGPLPPHQNRKVKSRSLPDQDSSYWEGVLITSKYDSHSASELCNSETSRGADFVSYKEGLYCDMAAKELWVLCDKVHTYACFDTKKNGMRPGKGLSGRDESSGRQIPGKSYHHVDEW
ncbi:hypothetical protein K440DRAFT_570280 [Wilcoxina mikolae CBS 423.85]|nr:hypothetical protein K440DRAFT_570280 [Wilcoxina mikolae CBS 423.85]